MRKYRQSSQFSLQQKIKTGCPLFSNPSDFPITLVSFLLRKAFDLMLLFIYTTFSSICQGQTRNSGAWLQSFPWFRIDAANKLHFWSTIRHAFARHLPPAGREKRRRSLLVRETQLLFLLANERLSPLYQHELHTFYQCAVSLLQPAKT